MAYSDFNLRQLQHTFLNASNQQLEQWAENILTAETLNQVFEVNKS